MNQKYREAKARLAKEHPGKCIGCVHWTPSPLLPRLDWTSPCTRDDQHEGSVARFMSPAGQSRLSVSGGFSCGLYEPVTDNT